MKLKVNESPLSVEGQPLTDGGKPITFRSVFFQALNAQLEGEQQSIDEKMKAYRLSQKLFLDDEVDVTVDEAALLKERVGKLFPMSVVGPVVDLLDGDKKAASANAGQN